MNASLTLLYTQEHIDRLFYQHNISINFKANNGDIMLELD